MRPTLKGCLLAAAIAAVMLASTATWAQAPTPVRLSLNVEDPRAKQFTVQFAQALDEQPYPLTSTEDPRAITVHISALDVVSASATQPADVMAYMVIVMQAKEADGTFVMSYLWSVMGVCGVRKFASCARELATEVAQQLRVHTDLLRPQGKRY